MTNKIEIYKSGDFSEVRVQFDEDTVWLNRQQLSRLFERDVKTIGKHLNKIFRDKELDKVSTVAKFATVQIEGDRTVSRDIEFYN